jgi:hypothetical protein
MTYRTLTYSRHSVMPAANITGVPRPGWPRQQQQQAPHTAQKAPAAFRPTMLSWASAQTLRHQPAAWYSAPDCSGASSQQRITRSSTRQAQDCLPPDAATSPLRCSHLPHLPPTALLSQAAIGGPDLVTRVAAGAALRRLQRRLLRVVVRQQGVHL